MDPDARFWVPCAMSIWVYMALVDLLNPPRVPGHRFLDSPWRARRALPREPVSRGWFLQPPKPLETRVTLLRRPGESLQRKPPSSRTPGSGAMSAGGTFRNSSCQITFQIGPIGPELWASKLSQDGRPAVKSQIKTAVSSDLLLVESRGFLWGSGRDLGRLPVSLISGSTGPTVVLEASRVFSPGCPSSPLLGSKVSAPGRVPRGLRLSEERRLGVVVRCGGPGGGAYGDLNGSRSPNAPPREHKPLRRGTGLALCHGGGVASRSGDCGGAILCSATIR
ncbi:hypothetical protein ACJJTC_008340 [Scirpophaga incertulas]